MDSHHEQVMRARAAAASDPPRRYFAWSTILDRAAFEEWRDQHQYSSFSLPAGEVGEAEGVALVYDFPSRWWGGRVAGIVDRPGSSVFGMVFEIAGVDWPIIRHKEGGITGMSVERPVRVRLASGATVEATAFATAPERRREEGPISPRFVEALVRGAESAGLPAAWVASLRTAG